MSGGNYYLVWCDVIFMSCDAALYGMGERGHDFGLRGLSS